MTSATVTERPVNIDAAIKEARLLATSCKPWARYDKHNMPSNEAGRVVRGCEYIIYALGGSIERSRATVATS